MQLPARGPEMGEKFMVYRVQFSASPGPGAASWPPLLCGPKAGGLICLELTAFCVPGVWILEHTGKKPKIQNGHKCKLGQMLRSGNW